MNDIKIALQTSDGKHFVCAENGGGGALNATRTEDKNWETFNMIGNLKYGKELSLRTFDGKHFVCAENGGGGALNATRTEDKNWETFTVLFV